MISSMTGFGRAESQTDSLTISVEVRSLNHRFTDIEIRAPRSLFAYESKVRETISSRLSRGRITLVISLKGEQAPSSEVSLDKQLAGRYLAMLNDLKTEFGFEDQISLAQVISFPDVLSTENSNTISDEIWQAVHATILKALDDLVDMRRREGGEIRKDLSGRVEAISEVLEKVEELAAERRGQTFEKLKQRISSLDISEPIDEGRLEMEIAVLADKMDVTEECIRFKSHNKLFHDLVAGDVSEGRKLNFLIQEMHREANTIGAKASDSDISHLVVEIKEEVEKLREQIQNIE